MRFPHYTIVAYVQALKSAGVFSLNRNANKNMQTLDLWSFH